MGLTRLESRQKQIQAEFLYMQGMANDAIAKEIKVSDKTIDRWMVALSWKDRRKLVDEEVSRKLLENASETKQRHIKISKAIQGQVIAKMQQDAVKLTASDAIRAMQLEKEWINPTEVKQFNFMKQENTQINIETNIHQLIKLAEEAKNKAWKSKNPSIL